MKNLTYRRWSLLILSAIALVGGMGIVPAVQAEPDMQARLEASLTELLQCPQVDLQGKAADD